MTLFLTVCVFWHDWNDGYESAVVGFSCKEGERGDRVRLISCGDSMVHFVKKCE